MGRDCHPEDRQCHPERASGDRRISAAGFFAALRMTGSLEVVPQTKADLLFEVVERFELTRLPVVVMQPEPHDLPRLIAPQPTGLRRQIAAPIDFLSKIGI